MKPFGSRLDRFLSPFFMCATVALLASAVLVIYLQHKALTTQHEQTRVVVQALSEKTANAIAVQLRRVIERPLLEAIAVITPPDVAHDRLDQIQNHFAQAMRHSHVERFFIWTPKTESDVPGEVLFYDRPAAAGDVSPRASRDTDITREVVIPTALRRDVEWGAYIYILGQEESRAQPNYAAVNRRVNDTPYEILFRLYWSNAKRDRLLGMSGYIVNLQEMRSRLFPALHERYFAKMFEPGEGVTHLEMQVRDDSGQLVFATGTPIAALSTRLPLGMQSWPAGRLVNAVNLEQSRGDWVLMVGPAVGTMPAVPVLFQVQDYLLGAGSVLLMLGGLVLGAQGYRRERQMVRAQAEFVAHASHQLKTPLTLLNGVCETLMLARARSPERQAEYLEVMRGATARLTALIERILEFSRSDTGRHRYEMEPINLSTLLTGTVETFRALLSDEQMQITFVTGQSPVVVSADPVAIEQAVVNLLDNAVKYSDGVKVISLKVDSSTTEAIIEVTDKGIGIGKHEGTRVFEKFYRGAGASMNRHGFGLGLAIVREIVTSHRGRIELESRQGLGSTFRIRLPLMRPQTGMVSARRLVARTRAWVTLRARAARGALRSWLEPSRPNGEVRHER